MSAGFRLHDGADPVRARYLVEDVWIGGYRRASFQICMEAGQLAIADLDGYFIYPLNGTRPDRYHDCDFLGTVTARGPARSVSHFALPKGTETLVNGLRMRSPDPRDPPPDHVDLRFNGGLATQVMQLRRVTLQTGDVLTTALGRILVEFGPSTEVLLYLRNSTPAPSELAALRIDL